MGTSFDESRTMGSAGNGDAMVTAIETGNSDGLMKIGTTPKEADKLSRRGTLLSYIIVVALFLLASLPLLFTAWRSTQDKSNDSNVPHFESPQDSQQAPANFKCFETSEELRNAVQLYLRNPDTDMEPSLTYGHPIGEWCVSQISDFTDMFSINAVDEDLIPAVESFNSSLSGWDTSRAVSLRHIFEGARSFNSDLSSWNVTSVKDFGHAFQGATSFNQDLGSWDVSSGEFFGNMFENCKDFEGIGLEHWNTQNAANMQRMFQRAKRFNGKIDTWDVRNVKNLEGFLRGAHAFHGDLGDWILSEDLANVEGMFQGALSFNGNLTGWGAQWPETEVTSFRHMFREAKTFDQNLNSWDTSNIVDMTQMFQNASQFNMPLGKWNVSSVKYFDGTFLHATSFNRNIHTWQVVAVESMGAMFTGASKFSHNLCSWREKLKPPTNVDGVQSLFTWTNATENDVLPNTSIFEGTACNSFENPSYQDGVFVGPFCHVCE